MHKNEMKVHWQYKTKQEDNGKCRIAAKEMLNAAVAFALKSLNNPCLIVISEAATHLEKSTKEQSCFGRIRWN